MPTAPQMLLDMDGTICYLSTDATKTTMTDVGNSVLGIMGDWNVTTLADTYSSNQVYNRYLTYLFPQPRDITDYSLRFVCNDFANAKYRTLRYSTDTTNGVDGTWTVALANLDSWHNANATNIRVTEPLALTGVKAVDLFYSNLTSTTRSVSLYNFNLFGDFTPTGIVFWDSAIDQQMLGSNFDLEDTIYDQSYVKQFRLKNTDTTLTANTITVSSPATPIIGNTRSGLEFSTNGTNYSSSVVIASLAPGVISSVLYIRRSAIPSSSQNTFGNARATAVPLSWS